MKNKKFHVKHCGVLREAFSFGSTMCFVLRVMIELFYVKLFRAE